MTAENRRWTLLTLISVLGLVALAPVPALAQLNDGVPKELENVDVDQLLGTQLPLDLRFVNDKGHTVKLADYFDGKRPVLITFNYYKCPMLCGLQLNGLVTALREMQWTPGTEFTIVSIGFDPLEGPKLAEAKKSTYIAEYGRAGGAKGWHFLTGEVEQIRTITKAAGFKYRWVEDRQEWAHPSTLIVASPTGKISRYFGGIVFDPAVLRLSMVEASEGKVGSLWDQIFLSCFHYVSAQGKYVPFAMGVMRMGGALTVVLLGILLISLTIRENRRRRRAVGATLPIGPGQPVSA